MHPAKEVSNSRMDSDTTRPASNPIIQMGQRGTNRYDGFISITDEVQGGSPIREVMVGGMLTGYRVLGFDLETTGLNPRSDRIVQYALIGSDVDGSHINQTALVNPRRSIPPESSRVHGITDEDVKGESEFSEHLPELIKLISDAVIVGHNVSRFDWRFLELECMRAGFEVPVPRAIIDTLTLARKLKIPGRHALGSLCARYDINIARAHSADADAGATLLLLWSMMQSHPKEFRGELDELQDMLSGNRGNNDSLGPSLVDLEPVEGTNGRLRHSDQGIVIAFGKHKGRTLQELQKVDKRYLDWLSSPSSPISSKTVSELLRNQRE